MKRYRAKFNSKKWRDNVVWRDNNLPSVFIVQIHLQMYLHDITILPLLAWIFLSMNI